MREPFAGTEFPAVATPAKKPAAPANLGLYGLTAQPGLAHHATCAIISQAFTLGPTGSTTGPEGACRHRMRQEILPPADDDEATIRTRDSQLPPHAARGPCILLFRDTNCAVAWRGGSCGGAVTCRRGGEIPRELGPINRGVHPAVSAACTPILLRKLKIMRRNK